MPPGMEPAFKLGLMLLGDQPSVVGVEGAESWKFYLRGLWLSGLRLAESLLLEWGGNTPGALVVDFDGRRPMLRIPAESEKGGQDRLLPMAPEFAEFLSSTPNHERHGRVFKLVGKRWADARMQADWVSRIVCRIGARVRVVVDQRERRLVVDGRGETKRKRSRATSRSQTTASNGSMPARTIFAARLVCGGVRESCRPCFSSSCGTSRLRRPCVTTSVEMLTR